MKYMSGRIEATRHNIKELVSELPAFSAIYALQNLEKRAETKNDLRDFMLYNSAKLLVALYGNWAKKDMPVTEDELAEYLSKLDHFVRDTALYDLASEETFGRKRNRAGAR